MAHNCITAFSQGRRKSKTAFLHERRIVVIFHSSIFSHSLDCQDEAFQKQPRHLMMMVSGVSPGRVDRQLSLKNRTKFTYLHYQLQALAKIENRNSTGCKASSRIFLPGLQEIHRFLGQCRLNRNPH
jgi:hypothetical protein